MDSIKINEKAKDESIYKLLSLIFGTSLIFIGFKDLDFFKIIIGFLLVFYFTYSKHIYLSDSGVVYKYSAFLFKREECLFYKDIDEITVVKQKNNSSIFLIKEPMAKKIVIDNKKLDEIVGFIKSKTNVLINFESR